MAVCAAFNGLKQVEMAYYAITSTFKGLTKETRKSNKLKDLV